MGTINVMVNGRDVYALGTLDAIWFLKKKVDEGKRGMVYTMIDVLRGA
jgi:4-hydroxy-tetrahydrodipicolinate reductase